MKHTALVFFFAGLISFGCDSREPSNFQSAVEPSSVRQVTNAPPNPKNQLEVVERKLIRNGEITFETSDIKKTKAAIDAICKELNAYVSNETQYNYDAELRNNQVIRVSADKFDLLIQKIEAEAKSVKSKNVNTQDVTEEFIDVEARLKTKKELEARYREILKQAKTVEEIVSIENQIASVRSEIESMEGRLKYLTSQVAYSTLNLSYYEIIGTDFGFGSKLGNALGSGWDGFLEFVIGLISLWPFLILITLLIWLVVRWRKRKRKKTDQ